MADVCPSCGNGTGYACNRLVCERDRVLVCTARVAGQVVQRDVEVPARVHKQRATADFLRGLAREFQNG